LFTDRRRKPLIFLCDGDTYHLSSASGIPRAMAPSRDWHRLSLNAFAGGFELKPLTHLLRTLTITAALFSAAAVLRAQNTLSATPSVVFLNATLGGGAVQQPVTVTSAPTALLPVTPTSTVPWLTFAASSPTTPTTITFIGNPAGMSAGVYSTLVNLTSASATTLPVLAVMTINAASPIASNPPNLTFNYTQGGPIPGAQSLALTAASATGYTVTGSANWLLFGGSNGTTPGTVTVGVNPAALATGAPNVAFATIAPTNGSPVLLVPIVLFISASPTLTASPSSLTFNYQIGGTSNVVTKNISITSSGPAIGFSAVASVNPNAGNVQWLSVTPASGSTPGTLMVTVAPGTLPPNTYVGTITVSSPGSSNPSQNIQVTLNVSTQPLLDLSTNSLNFNYQIGGTLPADQTLIPNATSTNLNYTIAVSTNNTGTWLSFTASGVTPAAVTVSVNPVGLPPGNYTGTLTFNAINGGNNPQVVQVTLNVSNNPTLSVNSSALSFNFETGQAAPPIQTVSVSSPVGSLAFTVTSMINTTSNGVNWLLVGTPSASSTPASFTVGVAPTGVAPGIYMGTIVLTAPGVANPNPSPGCPGTLCIAVTLNVSNMALLSASPNALQFSALLGAGPTPQSVTVNSTGESAIYTVTGAVVSPQGGAWLTVGAPSGPASAASPSSFFVGVVANALGAGVYKANITVHPANGNPDVIIPVTLTVSLGNLTVNPGTLNFAQAAGGAAPASQTISIGSTGAILQFTAFTSSASWLTVNPNSGATPGQITVSVNGAALNPGTYTAQVNVVSSGAGNSPQPVTVNLTVGQGTNLVLSPTSMTFTSQFGAGAPATQALNVSANATIPFTAVAAVSSPAGGSWLKVTPSSGTATGTVSTLSVSVDPTGLNPGTYTGTVTFTATGATNPPQTLNVTYTVTPSGTGGGVTRVLPQYAFGGGWYTALYFTNTTASPVTFTVNIIGDNGQPLNVAALGGSSVTVNLPARGSTILEAPNVGTLSQGYVLVSLPAGVYGYGVFRQSITGITDQEAVVQLSGATATTSTLLFDETKFVNGVAVVNLGSIDTTVSVIARDSQGNGIGTGSLAVPAKQKVELALRDIPGMSGVVGKMGSVDFTVSIGNLAALGIRFNGPAFTSVPTTDR
jgi:hypothetical protein